MWFGLSKERLAILLDNEGHLTGAPELVIEVLFPGVHIFTFVTKYCLHRGTIIRVNAQNY